MLTILHFTPYAGYGGTEKAILNLCTSTRDIRHLVWFDEKGPIIQEFVNRGFSVFVTENVAAQKDAEVLQNVRDLNISQINILHIHCVRCIPAIHKVAVHLECPFIVTLHGRSMMPLTKSPIVCVSRAVARMQNPNNTVYTIYNGIKVDDFSYSDRSDITKQIIIRVCRRQRCATYFLDAMKAALKACPKSELWLAGEDGDSMEQIRYLGVRQDIPHLLAKASIFAYAPEPDVGAHDLCVLEAMAAGVPPVVTDVPCVNESVTHLYDGILVPYGDADAFSTCVIRLLHDETLRRTLAQQGRATVVTKFNSFQMADAYTELYRRVISRAPTAHADLVDLGSSERD